MAADVAELAHDAIVGDRFCEFTDEVWCEPVAGRHHEIDQRSTPTLPTPRKTSPGVT